MEPETTGGAGSSQALSLLAPSGEAAFGGSGGRRGRLRRPVLACAGFALIFLTGCQVRLEVDLDVRADGGGEVRATVVLDKDAADQVPDLAQDLRVDDLEAAGWSLEGPSKREDATVELEAAKSFADPAGAERALQELSGPNGPLRDFDLQFDRSFVETRSAVDGSVDLTPGLEGFSDEVLQQRLGAPLGVDVAAHERRTGRPLRDSFQVRVTVRLPGEEPAVASPALGQRQELAVAARRWNRERIAFSAVALVSGLALVGVVLRRALTSS